jgi:CheY-like chemotaxis protein
MPLTVVLAVGMDAWRLITQSPIWKSAGYIAVSAASIKEGIDYFRAGDFDLVLMGHSIPAESKRRLAYLIRATGAQTPVVSIEKSPQASDPFADATIHNDTGANDTGANDACALLSGIGKLLADKAELLLSLRTVDVKSS